MKNKIAVMFIVFGLSLAAAGSLVAQYHETDLTGFTPSQGTPRLDPNLNRWAMVRLPNGTYVIADTCPGVATFYAATGEPLPTVITVPAAPSQPFGPIGSPTGVVYNTGSDFVISANGKSDPARLIFDTLDGTISGWNPKVDPKNAIIMVDNSTQPIPASYTGLAIGRDGHGRRILYAADGGYGPDFSNNRVDMFDSHWNRVGSFGDPNASIQYPGNTVFQVETERNAVVVTYGGFTPPFGGVVDIFDRDGNLLTPNHFAANQPGAGPLSNPWAITKAPANFGPFSNALLIGNVEDGRISAYNDMGQFLGQLNDSHHHPISVTGLWELLFARQGHEGSSNRLYFAAGPDAEDFAGDGLFGFITANGK